MELALHMSQLFPKKPLHPLPPLQIPHNPKPLKTHNSNQDIEEIGPLLRTIYIGPYIEPIYLRRCRSMSIVYVVFVYSIFLRMSCIITLQRVISLA